MAGKLYISDRQSIYQWQAKCISVAGKVYISGRYCISLLMTVDDKKVRFSHRKMAIMIMHES